MAKISVVINTLNEEKNIPYAIKSVKDFAGEIVVVDMNSDDKTTEIARNLGAKVYFHEQTDYVEPARNFAIGKATGDWILILDADERLTPILQKKLQNIVKENGVDFVRLPRKNVIFGKWLKHSRWWPDYNIRFFKKGTVTWNEIIHSVPMTTGTGIDLLPKEKYALIHYHYKSVEQYLERMNRYTSVQADIKAGEGEKVGWGDFIIKPSEEFMSRYFLGRGYKDGTHGLVISMLQAFSELVLCVKLWQKEKYKDYEVAPKEVFGVIKNTQRQVNYWIANTLYTENKSIVQRLKRKFKLP